MPVQASAVQVGVFFITANRQLRKVTEITGDEQARTRVHYLSKSANIPNREFNFGHPKASPPLLDTFIADCDHLLGDTEIMQLRESNILLSDE